MPRHRPSAILALALLLCCHGAAGVARAQTTLQVSVGWGQVVNAGRWNPVYVTLSNPQPRNVTLEFHTPYDAYRGVRIDQAMTIGPQAQTFVLYLPLRNVVADDLSVVVRDAGSRKKLASVPSDTAVLRNVELADPSRRFLGVSGRRATLREVTGALSGAMLQAAYLDPAELPTDPIGYDCLDVLVLNAPDFNALSDEQQQAIAGWVRAGGGLLLWPGDDPVPPNGPLVDLLPCRIGSSAVIELPPDALAKAGLPRRFGKLTARELSPMQGAEPVPLLGDRVTAYRSRVGLGCVVVAPTDLTALSFDNAASTWKVWSPALQGLVRKLPKDASKPPEPSFGINETAAREGAALREVGDLLGNVPGAGRFGFGYVAGVMIAMMVVVGPVDWFVLKKLGRQPWTWVTTGGWISLVTLAALYAGHLFKSGDLHFRTFQLVDQVDGAAAARTDLVALYSPRTAEYDFGTPAESWWQPAAPGDEYGYYRRSGGAEAGFHQTYRGSQPEPMVVNVWNLQFLKGSATGKGPALVDASLTVVPDPAGAGKRIVGTVTNLGPTAMKNLAVRTQEGLCRFAARAPQSNRIEPGQTVKVDAFLDPEVRPADDSAEEAERVRRQIPGYYGGYSPTADTTRLGEAGGDLATRRSNRIAQWLADRKDLACVYGELESPGPVVKLAGRAAIEQHWKVVRALVPLKR